MRSDAPLLVTEMLLRQTAGITRGLAAPPTPLDERTWLETIRLASAHLVLPALAPALADPGPGWTPAEDTRAYLETIARANRDRNQHLRSSLTHISGQLGAAGIDAVAVKGAAFLAASADAAPWRFLSDLDLIVAAADLENAVGVLAAAGFVASREEYLPDRDAHAPPMLGPDGITVVELHSRPFAEGDWTALETELWSEARIVDIGGVEIRIPSPAVRVAYLALHSQSHHGYFADSRLLLRDLLDLAMLQRESGLLDLEAAIRTVPELAREGVLALLAAAGTFGLDCSGIIFAAPQCAWAERARGRLSQPLLHRQLTATLSLAGAEAKRLLHDRKRTLRLAKSIARPSKLAPKLLKKLAKLRNRTAG
ncbi:MAG: nucleotidyltransferase family protein [Hyphomicrobiaceae bacterium]